MLITPIDCSQVSSAKKNTLVNFADPENGGAKATNFFIFGIKSLCSSLTKLVKVNKVPNECAIITTGFPVFLYNLLICDLKTSFGKLFVDIMEEGTLEYIDTNKSND